MTEAVPASATRRACVALYVSAVLAAVALGSRGPLYWDSFGYVGQALSGQVGGLALGRPLFVLGSHGLALGLQAAGGSASPRSPRRAPTC
jgi:hypothetical protein